MASSSYTLTSSLMLLLVLLLLLQLVAPRSCFMLPLEDEPPSRTRVVLFDEDPEDFKQRVLQRRVAPWIAVDEHPVTTTLADTDGFRITSAILEQHPLNSFISVNVFYKERNGTKLFVPNCDGITLYIRALENEKEVLEKEPGMIDDLRSGRRRVERLSKRVESFYGGGNVSVSHPFVYSPSADADEKEGILVHGADGFGSLEFPDEQNNKKMKVEMVMVASIVHKNFSLQADWSIMFGITELYSLYF